MNLVGVLEVLGVDPTTLPSNDKGEINLYTKFGKHPVAHLILNDDKFVLRFGESVQPSSSCEVLPSGGVRTEPVKLNLNKE